MKNSSKHKQQLVITARARNQKLRSIISSLRRLADYLDQPLARKYAGLTYDWRLYDCQIEAGALLYEAIKLGAFDEHRSLRRLVMSQQYKPFPLIGYKNAFDFACRKWIPRQPDGFDFAWKHKQVGETKAYVMGMRYFADSLVKSLSDEESDFN